MEQVPFNKPLTTMSFMTMKKQIFRVVKKIFFYPDFEVKKIHPTQDTTQHVINTFLTNF